MKLLALLLLFAGSAFGQMRMNSFMCHPRKPWFKDGLQLGNFSNATNWQEISGMAASTLAANSSYLWVESDSPANMLACVDTNGTSAGVWTLSGVSIIAPADWEDIASAKINGVSYIYVCDFGDNGSARATFSIHRCIEPVITGAPGTIAAGNIHTIVCQFPAGNMPTQKDLETLIVDPDTGDLYFITKRETIPGVYYLAHAASYAGTQTLGYLGKMYDIPDAQTQSLGVTACNVVAGCISRNGKDILIKNYNVVYYFARPDKAVSIYTTLTQTPVAINYVGGGSDTPRKSHPNQEPQGEAICFSPEGRSYFSCSEYGEGSSATAYPLFRYDRVSSLPTTVAFQEGLFPTGAYAGTADTYVWGTNPTTNYGNDPAIVLDITVGTPTDDRRALLKFDLSSIPTTATVVSARLELYIAAEGQGWAWYRMLAAWTEASTYSTTGALTPDGINVSAIESCRNGGANTDNVLGIWVRDNVLLSDVQFMVKNPAQNRGWLGVNTDAATGDGMQFDSSESTTAIRRPKLIIQYN